MITYQHIHVQLFIALMGEKSIPEQNRIDAVIPGYSLLP